MKKILLFSLAIVAAATTFTGCKKGENDPFLSLKSRRGRLAGEWKLTSADVTSKTINSFGGSTVTTTTVTKYDGTTETRTTTTAMSGSSSTTTNTYRYTTEFSFNKDGSYKMVNVDNDNNGTYTEEGSWAFVGKSKNAELKNKEAIVLSETSTNYSQGGNTSTSNTTGFEAGQTLILDQLKNKEVVIKMNYTFSETGSSSEYSGTYVLTAK
ncbi:MAG: hypothetical protein ACK4K0_02530 [Flavobacteriales bacterium]